MQIQAFPSGPFETNAYVAADSKTGQAAVIDPAPESADSIIQSISSNDLIPTLIILTHTHWDHIGDVAKIKETYNIPVIVHPLDAPNLENPGSDGLPCWITIKGVTPDKTFDEGDTVTVGSINFTVIHTPGHTPGGVCLYSKEHDTLISGDTLFHGSIGNLSFPGCSPKDMWTSLAKLEKLPPETKVYPGHGPATTIGQEPWLPRAQQIFG